MKRSALAFESQPKRTIPSLDPAGSRRELLSLEDAAGDNELPIHVVQVDTQKGSENISAAEGPATAMFFLNSANDRPAAWKVISGICPPLTCWNTSSTIPMSPAIFSAVSRTPETSRSFPANFKLDDEEPDQP